MTSWQQNPTKTEIRYLYENALAQIETDIRMSEGKPHHEVGLADRIQRKVEAALRHDFMEILPTYIRPKRRGKAKK